MLLAFASGALISALAFELFEEAFDLGGAARSGIGLLAGAAAFVVADSALDRYVPGDAGADEREVAASGARGGVGWALLAAVTLDGVPGEPRARRLARRGGLGHAARGDLLLEPPRVARRRGGHARARAAPRASSWARGSPAPSCSAAAVVAGRALAGPLSDEVLAVALGFAGGAVLASLADTLMPEAFEHGRPFNAFATAAGFFLSFVLAA